MDGVTRTFSAEEEEQWVAAMGGPTQGPVPPICGCFEHPRTLLAEDGRSFVCPRCSAVYPMGGQNVRRSIAAEAEQDWVRRQAEANETGRPSREQFGANDLLYDRATAIREGHAPAPHRSPLAAPCPAQQSPAQQSESPEARAELRKRARAAIGDAKRCVGCGLPLHPGRSLLAIEAALRWRDGVSDPADWCSAACVARS